MNFRRYLMAFLALLFIATGVFKAEGHCQMVAAPCVMPCCQAREQEGEQSCCNRTADDEKGMANASVCDCDSLSHDALLTTCTISVSPDPVLKSIALVSPDWYDWRKEPLKLHYRGPPKIRGPAGKIYLINRALLI